jgi:hypothetical protein
MLESLLTRLYSHLLKLYPDRFLDEFGGEMGDLFAQALSDLDDSGTPSTTRRVKMTGLFIREVWYFPLAYLDARRYHFSIGDPLGITSFWGQGKTETWVGKRAPWGASLVGALPFLLFGLAALLDGFAELGGHASPAIILLDGSHNRPYIPFTALMGVYLFSLLGLLFGVLKGFPRWSYAYLGMSFFLAFYYSSGSFYGINYSAWARSLFFAAIILGLLLAHSFQPLYRLLRGAWNDWTRLSFALYAVGPPFLMLLFLEEDWGISHLYGLLFDTLVLTAGAVVFLRSRTILGRVLSLLAVVLILVVKGLLRGWGPSVDNPLRTLYFVFSIIIIYLGFLLLPALIGLLKRGVDALSAR